MDYTLDEQIQEVKLELLMRKSLYTKQVNRKKMKPELARSKYDKMQAVLNTLEELKTEKKEQTEKTVKK